MPSRRILLVATMRNEGPYVSEWLAYHRSIGFTDVLVCTNDCVDGSPELLDRLEQLGLLVHLRSTPASRREAQLVAYTSAAATAPGARCHRGSTTSRAASSCSPSRAP